MNPDQQKIIFEQAGFKCQKCGYYSPLGEGLEINKEHSAVLCSICNAFSPSNKTGFEKYLAEKLQWQTLETFRNSGANKASHSPHKQGMLEKYEQGKLMARPPYGYKVIDGNLIVDDESSENIKLIFEEFANSKSLNQISKNYGMSVNGIKKILKNFTYLGKIKFAGNITQGSHQPLISSELFNRVQKKFEDLAKRKSLKQADSYIN